MADDAIEPEVIGTFYGYPVIVTEHVPGGGPWALIETDPGEYVADIPT